MVDGHDERPLGMVTTQEPEGLNQQCNSVCPPASRIRSRPTSAALRLSELGLLLPPSFPLAAAAASRSGRQTAEEELALWVFPGTALVRAVPGAVVASR